MEIQSKHASSLLLGLIVTMTSCTTLPAPAPVVFPLDTPDHVSPMKVEDQRQPEQRMLRPRRSGSSIYRLGDENFEPDRLKALAVRFGNILGSAYADEIIAIEYFEVTISNPPPPSRSGAYIPPVGEGVPGLIATLFLSSLMTATSEPRERFIVVCEIRGSVNGRDFRGASDRVVPDPKVELFDAVRAVVREAIDDAADNLLKTLP